MPEIQQANDQKDINHSELIKQIKEIDGIKELASNKNIDEAINKAIRKSKSKNDQEEERSTDLENIKNRDFLKLLENGYVKFTFTNMVKENLREIEKKYESSEEKLSVLERVVVSPPKEKEEFVVIVTSKIAVSSATAISLGSQNKEEIYR